MSSSLTRIAILAPSTSPSAASNLRAPASTSLVQGRALQVEQWYFNGVSTVERQTKDAIAAHLGGVMVWELGQDCLSYHDGPCRHAAPPLTVRELRAELPLTAAPPTHSLPPPALPSPVQRTQQRRICGAHSEHAVAAHRHHAHRDQTPQRAGGTSSACYQGGALSARRCSGSAGHGRSQGLLLPHTCCFHPSLSSTTHECHRNDSRLLGLVEDYTSSGQPAMSRTPSWSV